MTHEERISKKSTDALNVVCITETKSMRRNAKFGARNITAAI